MSSSRDDRKARSHVADLELNAVTGVIERAM